MNKKAILVVSFGTSYQETREKTITAIENSLKNAFLDHRMYGAFTSKVVKQKLEREGIQVFNVKEALEQMLCDGVTELLVQSTHMIHGVEYEVMMEELKLYSDKFTKMEYGQPLLSSEVDYEELARIIYSEYPVDDDEALVVMGHGSNHHANAAYPAFEYVLRDMGHENMLVGTVEGYPSFAQVKKQLKEKKMKKVCLVPMMIVAGDHAHNDMAGGEDSWKTELEQEGYEVRYYMKGLGELSGVQNMFIRHARNPVVIK